MCGQFQFSVQKTKKVVWLRFQKKIIYNGLRYTLQYMRKKCAEVGIYITYKYIMKMYIWAIYTAIHKWHIIHFVCTIKFVHKTVIRPSFLHENHK